ncbi:MAG TPA: type II toxin-antitoxin system HigB family toxin [Candidatus Egerieousia sp.]|nr:type II toxin-antitoxin system HigB family toxin [Candidatus Egerieousia sp.]
MRIIAHRSLVLFYQIHKDSKVALEDWYDKVNRADWDNFAGVKQTFNSVDCIGNKRYVFNIHGNDYRLVAIVLFRIKMVYIRFIGTHEKYNNIKDIENI